MAKAIDKQIAELKERRSTLIQEQQPADWADTSLEEQERVTAKILARDDVQDIERDISALRLKQAEAN